MKKLLPGFAVVAMAIASCSSPPPVVNENMYERNPANEAVVKKYIDAIVHGTLGAMDTLLADNYMGYGPATKDSTNKADNIAGWKHEWDSVYSSITYNRYAMLSVHIDSGRVAGDWVFDWGKATLNYRTGKTPVNFLFHAVYKMKDQKIIQETDFFDVNDILVQRGFTVTPPAAPKKKK